MSTRIIPFILLSVLLDLYLYFSLGHVLPAGMGKSIFIVFLMAVILLSYYSFFKLDQKIRDQSLFHGSGINFYIGFLISSLVTRLVYCGSMLLYDFGRMIWALFNIRNGLELPLRIPWVIMLIACFAFVIFIAMIYGMTFGKYNYKVEKLKLSFNDLPKAFDGFKIVQISDMHAGSYDGTEGLSKGISLINEQQPDIILFTGDLVNDHKDEVDPYIKELKKLKSKYGAFAVLGNHDYYGAYRQPNKERYWNDFFDKFTEMGFILLNNQNHELKIGDDSIRLVGVENWGNANWTPKRGDLDVALKGVGSNEFCVLMTHDPSHWENKVLMHAKEIHLSLAGHTHGFQFGINLPFLKWSPAQYRYPRWMGLYNEGKQYLYVNRGFGFIAFPGRVGMRPEITVLTLKCNK